MADETTNEEQTLTEQEEYIQQTLTVIKEYIDSGDNSIKQYVDGKVAEVDTEGVSGLFLFAKNKADEVFGNPGGTEIPDM